MKISIKSNKKRMVIYVLMFEVFAIILNSLLLHFLSNDESHGSVLVAVAVSFIAMSWNYIFNLIFQWGEYIFNIRKRTILIRSVHSVLFEFGLFLFTIPLYIYWYNVTIIKAFQMEFSILLFFLIYTYLFTLAFDHVFPENRVVSHCHK
ncbi:PACE efflux transporter [Salmonella enterica]|nr:PACE efflux transporter [Salmonella enterica]EAW3956579.1 PACE efflux transporter [Salmonella enterica subsp. enterica]EBV6531642.1 PACE efflux transporter [Salmonella enterica subsp. enterica serovar Oranienburg]EDC0987233.1 PACE efflux transporter [Salmonella enterica subsp. enterica serovar Give]EEK0870659.1 PACE efflux transporter [Salmonella enterica subsp. enterica serovar Dublin]EEM2803243.1 PACE efflux transporter [Salmonella enterica subsp. enterica serovar Rubislaw]